MNKIRVIHKNINLNLKMKKWKIILWFKLIFYNVKEVEIISLISNIYSDKLKASFT